MDDLKTVLYDIERCTCHVPDACRDCSHYLKGQTNGGMSCIEDLLTDAYKLLHERQWISVSERLPTKPKLNLRRGWYLVALESGCVMSLGFEYDGRKWFNTKSPVTHWMPLPKPPKEVGTDETV